MQHRLEAIIQKSKNRTDLWQNFLKDAACQGVAEIGVYKGDFAKNILKECPSVVTYLMIDPWRNLSDWNKPANADDKTFEGFYQESMQKTEFAAGKRQVLRGTTMEVVDKIRNNELDFAYIDGDHTLKGITIDLISLWPKIKSNGFIGGDDFSSTIWQHSDEFEPTMVFPFAVYFAEAVNATIYGLPHKQFLIDKGSTSFKFIDLTGGLYKHTEIRQQLLNSRQSNSSIKVRFAKKFPAIYGLYKKLFR